MNSRSGAHEMLQRICPEYVFLPPLGIIAEDGVLDDSLEPHMPTVDEIESALLDSEQEGDVDDFHFTGRVYLEEELSAPVQTPNSPPRQPIGVSLIRSRTDDIPMEGHPAEGFEEGDIALFYHPMFDEWRPFPLEVVEDDKGQGEREEKDEDVTGEAEGGKGDDAEKKLKRERAKLKRGIKTIKRVNSFRRNRKYDDSGSCIKP